MAGAFNKKGGWGKHVVTYRSGLEEKVGAQLEASGQQVSFEEHVIQYVIPESFHNYHPDFLLPNGLLIETKGIFSVEDRKKHLLIRKQHPELDIRLVFSNSKAKLYKGSKTTYAAWCEKYGFKYADKQIPQEWLREPPRGTPGLIPKKTNKKETQ